MLQNKQTEYEKYLVSMHAKLITPEDIIKRVVLEGTKQESVNIAKIIAGEANEVYDVTLPDKTHVILRISRNRLPDFQQERWAIQKAKSVEVPVPDILLIKYLKINNKQLSFCLMNKIEGEPLERGKINFDNFPEDIKRSYIIQAGEILSRIHSIKTDGYGWIIRDGKTEYNTSDEIIDEILNKRGKLAKLTKSQSINIKDINRAMKIIEQFRTIYTSTSPHLNHSDFGHKHFMVKDGKIVAILDWGGVRSDTSIYDFACWDYWYGEYIPIAWLKEGYDNKIIFNSDFEDILHFLRIMKGIEIIDWYVSQGYQKAVDKALHKFSRDILYFK